MLESIRAALSRGRANLEGALLDGTQLTDANLSGANLLGAYMYLTSLGGTNFSGALLGPYLQAIPGCVSGSNCSAGPTGLPGINLDMAGYTSSTTLPNGTLWSGDASATEVLITKLLDAVAESLAGQFSLPDSAIADVLGATARSAVESAVQGTVDQLGATGFVNIKAGFNQGLPRLIAKYLFQPSSQGWKAQLFQFINQLVIQSGKITWKIVSPRPISRSATWPRRWPA